MCTRTSSALAARWIVGLLDTAGGNVYRMVQVGYDAARTAVFVWLLSHFLLYLSLAPLLLSSRLAHSG